MDAELSNRLRRSAALLAADVGQLRQRCDGAVADACSESERAAYAVAARKLAEGVQLLADLADGRAAAVDGGRGNPDMANL